jgi:hypothetical protein
MTESPHWERGYRSHGYWRGDIVRLGRVTLPPRGTAPFDYSWEVDGTELQGKAKTLETAKHIVERWVAGQYALATPARLHQYRGRAFSRWPDPPEKWRPRLHDEVYLPRRTPFKLTQAGEAIALLDGGEYVRVLYTVNRVWKSELLWWQDLRPTGRRFEDGQIVKVLQLTR